MSLNLQFRNPRKGKAGPNINSISDILGRYLEKDADAAEVATLLVGPINKECSQAEEAEDGLADLLWSQILDTVASMPFDHPYVTKLVQLLAAIKEMPKPAIDTHHWAGEYWRDLPGFGMEVRESWNFTPSIYPSSRAFTRQQWLSLNAFIAQVAANDVANFKVYAIWALRDALETEPKNIETFSSLDDLLPAAAVWILYVGTIVYTQWLDDEEDSRADIVGPLLKETGWKGFRHERWVYWKERFDWVRSEAEVEDETREIARMAMEKMREIEEKETPHGVVRAGCDGGLSKPDVSLEEQANSKARLEKAATQRLPEEEQEDLNKVRSFFSLDYTPSVNAYDLPWSMID